MSTIDLTNINRFKNKDQSFVDKVLHELEKKDYEVCKNKAKFLATHWAIKEAIFKADNKYSVFCKINIVKKDRQYIFKNFVISTTSEDNYIIAIVEKRK